MTFHNGIKGHTLNNSKTISVACLAFLATFALTGCNQAGQPPIAAGWYRLEVEKIVESDDMIIAQLKIEFAGEHTVALDESDGHSSSRISPDPNTGLSTCQVLLVADLMTFGKGENKAKHLKWLARIRSKGGHVGGPSIYLLKEDKPLNELFQLQVKSGEYAMGLEQEIAIFRDDVLVLTIGK